MKKLFTKVNEVFQRRTINYFTLGNLIAIFMILFLQLPFFTELNFLITDKLQGSVEPRKDIVIIAIDDRSLQEIDAWPWSRDKFAFLIDKVGTEKASVIGFDILFLESREGDEKFKASLGNARSPVVLGSKIVDDTILTSFFAEGNTKSGFVNFSPDADGKIRETKLFYQDLQGICHTSLALSLFKQHLKLAGNDNCSQIISVRNNSFKTDENGEIRFNYSKQNYTRVSFVDFVNGKYEKDLFKDKIVIVGSTALDVRSSLNDNFTNIFGETIPGVEIHANIINSMLENEVYNSPNKLLVILIVFIFVNLELFLLNLSKRNFLDFVVFSFLAFFSLLLGLMFIEFNFLWNFITIFACLIIIYFFTIAHKFIFEKREKFFIKNVFGKYLNDKLLDQLVAEPQKLKLGGQLKNMSVLFSDIRGFTTLSEGLTPEELVSMINNYLNTVSKIIIENNGTIDKYIGDAVMAMWNAPLDDEKHATHAVETALKMMDELENFNKLNPNYPDLKIGIGVNSGDMVVGNIGGDMRFDYTVLGDNVNLGSRLEGLTKKYGVQLIVSESTKEGVEDANIIFRLLDEVIVKGKEKAIKIYEPMKKDEKNIGIVENYEKGFGLYQKGDFESAVDYFKKNKDDLASNIMVERIGEIEKTDPSATLRMTGWNGVWKWDEK